MTNPDELRREFGHHPRRNWLRWLLAVLVLAGMGAAAARPGWRAFKTWRSDQFLAQAESFLEQGQAARALERARSAFQLAPHRTEVLRLNAQVLTRLGSENALAFWQRLTDLGVATADDQASHVEAALQFQRSDLVADLVSELDRRADLPERARRIAALHHLQARHPEAAVRHAREAYRLSPYNPTNALLLAGALLDLKSSATDTLAESRDLFAAVGRTNGPLQAEALLRLVNHPAATRAHREETHRLLTALPQRSPAQEVLLAETEMLLNPARQAELASNLLARLRPGDWPTWIAVVDALLRRGRHAEILAATEENRGLPHARLFLARYEALVATGQREEGYRHLLHADAPLPPFERIVARARGAQEAGNQEGRDGHFRELLVLAQEDPRRLRQVAELAEAGQSRDSLQIATEAWQRLARMPGGAIEALRRLQALADRQGDTWLARDFARRAVRAGAHDPDLALAIAHYDLLLGEEIASAVAVAERQWRARTNDFFARAVLALGHLRLGAPEQSRKLLEGQVVDTAELRPDALAVVVATCGATGLEVRARALAATLPLALLRPEERELVRPWIVPPTPQATAP